MGVSSISHAALFIVLWSNMLAEDMFHSCWVGSMSKLLPHCCDRLGKRQLSIAMSGWRLPWAALAAEHCPDSAAVMESCCEAMLPWAKKTAVTAPCPPLPNTCAHEVDGYAVPKVVVQARWILIEYAHLNSTDRFGALWSNTMRFLEASQQIACMQTYRSCFANEVIESLCTYLVDIIDVLQIKWGLTLAGTYELDIMQSCMALIREAPATFFHDFFLRIWDATDSAIQRLGLARWPSRFHGVPPPMDFHAMLPVEAVPGDVCNLIATEPWPWFIGHALGTPAWIDASGSFTSHADIVDVVRYVASRGARLSKKVINLGAFDGTCRHRALSWAYDAANCLVEKLQFDGILFEYDSASVEKLRQLYKDRPNVHVVEAAVSPSNIRDLIEGVDLSFKNEVDLLKLDIDNSECSLLAPILDAVGLPKFIHAEVSSVFPPEISYVPGYRYGMDDLSWRMTCSACSLGAFLDVLGDRYRLLQLEFEDALFVRTDMVPLFGPLALRHPTLLWHIGYFCHPLARNQERSTPIDLRALGNEEYSIPLRVHYAHAMLRGWGCVTYELQAATWFQPQRQTKNYNDSIVQKQDAVDANIESKIDMKLASFMKGAVQDAFQAAFEAFSSHVSAKLDSLEERLAEVEHHVTGNEVKSGSGEG